MSALYVPYMVRIAATILMHGIHISWVNCGCNSYHMWHCGIMHSSLASRDDVRIMFGWGRQKFSKKMQMKYVRANSYCLCGRGTIFRKPICIHYLKKCCHCQYGHIRLFCIETVTRTFVWHLHRQHESDMFARPLFGHKCIMHKVSQIIYQ